MPYRGTRREEMYSRERIADSPYYRDALSIGAGYGHDGERMLNAIQQAQRAAFTASGIPGLADMLIADQELWQDIPGFEGIYQASTQGNIRSVDRYVTYNIKGRTPFTVKKEGVILKTWVCGGYKEVRLYDAKTGTLRHMKVHTAVLTAFTGPRPDGYEVNHIDEDRSNNRLENLEWMTPIDNCRYSKALPVDMLDEDGNVIKTFPSIRATADDGFIPEDVRRAAYGTREMHGGYQWAFSSETSRRKPSRLTQSRRRYMR